MDVLRFVTLFCAVFLHLRALAASSPLVFAPKKDAIVLESADAKKVVQPFVNLARYQFIAAPGHTGQGALETSFSTQVASVSDESRKLAIDTFENADGHSLATAWPHYAVLPRFGLTFGLPQAFDVGVEVGWIPYSKLFTYGLGLQITLIDGPGTSPIVSARAGASFLKSASKAVVNANALSFELVAGTRLSRADVYVGFAGAAYENTSKWVYASETKDYQTSWNDVFLMFGAQSLLLPYLQASGELQISSVQWVASLKFGLIIL